ncbi:unnamed protein product, partial [Clonostachys rosea f. rosea IK726]
VVTMSLPQQPFEDHEIELPDIQHGDSFRQVVRKLSLYFGEAIELPSTYEQLRTTSAGSCLRALVDHLAYSRSQNPAVVNALLALKWHYASEDEQQGVDLSRSHACEIVAWRFLSRVPERDVFSYCLYEIPAVQDAELAQSEADTAGHYGETSPLLARFGTHDSEDGVYRPPGSSGKRVQLLGSLSFLSRNQDESSVDFNDPAVAFKGLNALEIAAIADAKRFMSQHVVQKIITGIWNGHIVYWDSLSTKSTKQPRFYDPQTTDPFSRLRVPKYMKYYEVAFFAVFLCLYYAVLIRGKTSQMTGAEVALLAWFLSFFSAELNEWYDAGSIFYATDFWNLFDVAMILIGFIFAVLRITGLCLDDSNLSGWAFDILALEALFMVPRICSILSLSPYWGTLIPCLKEMGKDFVKFMVLVVICYMGFLTTFSLLGRKVFTFAQMAMILTKIFFGSSYIGFEMMSEIDPLFGPPLVILFVTLTNFLLLGSLTGMLSNSFMKVTSRAREEYLYVYSVYVLEASTSNRLVHFYPPFNLLALLIFRPWALLVGKSRAIRKGRIVLLRITHLPLVGVIKLYELFRHDVFESELARLKDSSSHAGQNGRSNNAAIRPRSARRQSTYAESSAGKDRVRKRSLMLEDEVGDESAVEAQLGELHRKIDQLTQIVIALQENQSASSTKLEVPKS